VIDCRKDANLGNSRSLHIIKHLSSFHHLVLFYRILQMTMLNFVLLPLLIGFLTAPSFFKSKMKHKTVNFSPYSWLPEFYYIFVSTIIVSINWIDQLIYKIRYIWRDMKESLFQISTHICSSFLSSLPHRSGTFKSLKYLFTERKALYSNKNTTRSKNHLIFLSILIILSPNQIKMDCTSRFSLYYHNCILTPSSQPKCWGYGGSGQLGYADTSNRCDSANHWSDYLPFVNVDSNVQSVQAGGDRRTCVHLSPSFDVKCWGRNIIGMLGYGDTQDRGDQESEMATYLPTIIFGSGVFVSEVSAGRFYNHILTDSGQIKAWGENTFGQLGYGDTNNRGDAANEMSDYLPLFNWEVEEQQSHQEIKNFHHV